MFMSRYFQIILPALICLNLVSCSLMPDEMRTAEQVMESAPDSALTILQQLSPDKYSSESNRALYGLLLFRALDKNLLPLKPDSLIDFSINYYHTHADYEHLAYCYLYKGRAYKYDFQNEKAMACYLKALDYAHNKKDDLLLGRINSDMGDIYNSQRDYMQARQRFILAYDCFTRDNNSIPAYYSLIDIGITHYASKRYDSAQIYFHQVYRQAKDSMTTGAALHEIGLCYYHAKQYDSALYYLRKVIHYPYIANNRAIRYYYLADLFFDLGKVDSANYYALNALQYAPDIRTQRECYRILVNSESKTGNITALTQYMAKYQDCSDSIRKIDAQTKGSVLETIHITTNEVQKSKKRLWYLLGIILTGTVLGFILFIQLKRRNKTEINESEKQYREQKADIRKGVMLNHRDALLQKIEKTKKAQTPERKKASQANKELMDRKLYDDLLHLNDLEFFYREMDAVLNNLVSKLNSRYPGITEKEKIWCCLHLLNLSTADMYILLDYSVNGLKTMRQRLSQKLDLAGVSELNSFLHKIISE